MNLGTNSMHRLEGVGVVATTGSAWVFSLADPGRVAHFLSTPQGWVQLAQIVSLFAASGWASFQVFRGFTRLRREQRLSAWVIQVQAKCEKAQAGQCPLKDELEKMERKD
jgi:hypothetical protein